jgi:hypothetical protein
MTEEQQREPGEVEMFFTLAKQDHSMKRKVDCVAFDYDHNVSTGVEIESPNHVQTHS